MGQLESNRGWPRGRREEPGEQFDPKKHKLAMVLRPLKEFRRVAGNNDVSVFNRNAGSKSS